MKSTLTIASSDPTGGAGIFADLRAFSYLGLHGTSVVCTVTAQNTQDVSKIHELPLDIIEEQMDSLLRDVRISSCKTGMLYSPQIAELVAKRIGDFKCPVVVDPVLRSSSGYSLFVPGILSALKDSLIPKAHLVTPNIPEAEALSGMTIVSVEDMRSACETIKKLGCDNVLITGGHLEDASATDVLFDGTDFRFYMSSFHSKRVHGTGCTHSALICGLLAKGSSLEDAVGEAKLHMNDLISGSCPIGQGQEVLGLLRSPEFSQDELEIVESLQTQVQRLPDVLSLTFVPEVGINFGYAKEDAKTIDDICALEGRLVRVGDRIGHLGALKFGSSRHIARIILTAMKFDPKKRSCMNIKYSPEIVNLCRSFDLSVGTFSRDDQPEDTSSMEWGTKQAIEDLGFVPDIIYDGGGVGKEPMIRILGNSPGHVVMILRSIVRAYHAQV